MKSRESSTRVRRAGKEGEPPPFAAAPLARAFYRGSRVASLAIKPGFLMIAAEEKKFSDHSNHMETGLKLESLLAGYSFPPSLTRYCDGQVYHIWQ